MKTGRWFVVVDEHHHYGNEDDAAWTRKIKELNYVALLAMSATPDRFDGADHFRPAANIGALPNGRRRRVGKAAIVATAYDYEIDAVTTDNGVIQFTTEELAVTAGLRPRCD